MITRLYPEFLIERFKAYSDLSVVKRDKTKGLKLNTISKYIKNLKLFYNDRRRKEHLPFINLSDFKRRNKVVDHTFTCLKKKSCIFGTWIYPKGKTWSYPIRYSNHL